MIFAPLNLVSLDMHDASDKTLYMLREHAPFQLEELRLVVSKLTFSAAAAFLREMHVVTTLKLVASIALTDELMEFLTYDARVPVLPALKSLDLSDRQDSEVFPRAHGATDGRIALDKRQVRTSPSAGEHNGVLATLQSGKCLRFVRSHSTRSGDCPCFPALHSPRGIG
jgi:hypothetical protein